MSTKIISVALEGNEHLSDDDRFMLETLFKDGLNVVVSDVLVLALIKNDHDTSRIQVNALSAWDILVRMAYMNALCAGEITDNEHDDFIVTFNFDIKKESKK